jgi:hypothetical protein
MSQEIVLLHGYNEWLGTSGRGLDHFGSGHAAVDAAYEALTKGPRYLAKLDEISGVFRPELGHISLLRRIAQRSKPLSPLGNRRSSFVSISTLSGRPRTRWCDERAHAIRPAPGTRQLLLNQPLATPICRVFDLNARRRSCRSGHGHIWNTLFSLRSQANSRCHLPLSAVESLVTGIGP